MVFASLFVCLFVCLFFWGERAVNYCYPLCLIYLFSTCSPKGQLIFMAARSDADRLLLELLAWFKKEFFSWVDSLPCDFCGKKTKVYWLIVTYTLSFTVQYFKR